MYLNVGTIVSEPIWCDTRFFMDKLLFKTYTLWFINITPLSLRLLNFQVIDCFDFKTIILIPEMIDKFIATVIILAKYFELDSFFFFYVWQSLNI